MKASITRGDYKSNFLLLKTKTMKDIDASWVKYQSREVYLYLRWILEEKRVYWGFFSVLVCLLVLVQFVLFNQYLSYYKTLVIFLCFPNCLWRIIDCLCLKSSYLIQFQRYKGKHLTVKSEFTRLDLCLFLALFCIAKSTSSSQSKYCRVSLLLRDQGRDFFPKEKRIFFIPCLFSAMKNSFDI